MKYKAGDYVKIISHSPPNPHLSPSWVAQMNPLKGKILRVDYITSEGFYRICGFSWREDWIENPASLEERICNKIKELDNKWKERQLKCA